MSDVEKRLNALGYHLTDAAKPKGAYVPALVDKDIIYVSGQVPVADDGAFLYPGKAGKDYTLEEAKEAAEKAAVQAINALHSIADLDRIKILKVVGFVNSDPSFTNQPQVINGASELFLKVFGEENGPHARSAVGVAVLPGDSVTEVELIARILPN